MLTFLFWNVGKKTLSATLAELARLHEVDFLILAECPVPPEALLAELNRGNLSAKRTGFRLPDARSQCNRVAIYARFPSRSIKVVSEGGKWTGREVCLPGREKFLLFATHFSSKLYQSSESQAAKVPGFSEAIRRAERNAGHERTVVVGDLNMNPFEPGMVAAEGLHAVMTREVASRERRTVESAEYPFFYNPMWGHFGDASHRLAPPTAPDHRPPGTYYYSRSESVTYFWNLFDQVLLRPGLLHFFQNDELRILTNDGQASFLNERGLPDSADFSDHLPILFRLHL